MEKEVKQPVKDGIVSMYWVWYSPLMQPLLLDEVRMKIYTQLMVAVNKGTPQVQKAFNYVT